MNNDEYDYQLNGSNAELLKEIPISKIFVAKSCISEAEAEATLDREKIDLFKGFFKRPKDTEVVIKSVKKSFEPYIILGGEYELRYLTERTYNIDLLDNTISVFILGDEIIVPEKEDIETEVEIKGKKKAKFFDGLFARDKKAPKPKPKIQLTGIEHVHIKRELMEAKNYNGIAVNPDSLPEGDLQEVSEQFLQVEAEMIPNEYVDIEKTTSDIIKEYTTKPEGVQRVLYEKITLTDRKIILYPIYWAKMTYKETTEKNVRLDGITGKIEEQKGVRYAPPPTADSIKTQVSKVETNKCPGCNEPIERDDKFCEHCGLCLY